jgi:ribosome-binding ATPase YchF (GTP1/OBG family)
MMIAVCGKSNTGKTTFFSSATLVDAEISNRIFTTIKPNKGVSYVRVECPCKKANVKCNPQNSKCVDGTRFIPVKLIDIAGLVPGAHKGKGLGNQFLTDIMEAQALIHVIDISGGSDNDGNPVAPGSHDPMHDVQFFEEEIDYWILGILKKSWQQLSMKMTQKKEKPEVILQAQLSGLGLTVDDVKDALLDTPVTSESNDQELMDFIENLRKKSKPIIIAANKVDVPGAEKNYEHLKEVGVNLIPTSAESELALRKAAESGIVKYSPGDKDFEITGELDEKQKKGLEFLKKNVLDKWGSTGIQKVIDDSVFKLLDMIVVYPVASIGKMTDQKGNVLPDAHLVKKGTTLKELAAKVHTSMAEKFLGGMNRDRRKLGADYELQDGDVIEILLRN